MVISKDCVGCTFSTTKCRRVGPGRISDDRSLMRMQIFVVTSFDASSVTRRGTGIAPCRDWRCDEKENDDAGRDRGSRRLLLLVARARAGAAPGAVAEPAG